MSERPFNRAFDFLYGNNRPDKPREKGIIEMRGPYYDPMGLGELRDILERWAGTSTSTSSHRD